MILEPPKIKSDTAYTNTRDISSIIPQRRNDITRLRELFKDPFGLILSWEERGLWEDLTLALRSLSGLGVMFSFLFGFVFLGVGSRSN